MKRLVYMMMALVVLFAANSCKDKKNRTGNHSYRFSQFWRRLPMIQPSTVFVVRVHLCTIWS